MGGCDEIVFLMFSLILFFCFRSTDTMRALWLTGVSRACEREKGCA
jgi:hypothetical protein